MGGDDCFGAVTGFGDWMPRFGGGGMRLLGLVGLGCLAVKPIFKLRGGAGFAIGGDKDYDMGADASDAKRWMNARTLGYNAGQEARHWQTQKRTLGNGRFWCIRRWTADTRTS